MKRFAAVASAALVIALAAPVSAADLTGTMSFVAISGDYVTIHAEQTSGDPVTLRIEHSCRSDTVYGPIETVRFTGSTDATFYVGPRKLKGQTLVPVACWAWLTYQMPSQTALILDGINTLGCDYVDEPCRP